METDVVTLQQDGTYEDAVKTLDRAKITGCPVVNSGGELVGVVSYKDLLRLLFPYYDSYYKNPESYTDFDAREAKASEIRDHRIETFMSSPAYSASPDMLILQAAAVMLAHHIQRLPVVDNGALVGIVTRTRILREIFKKNFDVE